MRLLSLALLLHVANTYHIKPCKSNFTNIDVKHVQIDPPDFGPIDEIKLQLQLMNNNKSFTDGFILYTIQSKQKLYEPQVNQLCSNIECPVSTGKQSLEFNAIVPSYVDDTDLKVELVDHNLTSFACFIIELELTWIQRFINWLYPPMEPINWQQHRLRGAY